MVKQTIQVFCRLKPTKHVLGLYDVNEEETEQPLISFTLPKDLADGFINNKKENYKFTFNHIFDQESKQGDVFNKVAQPVIDNVLCGFNGTIFAYGQTGSGKTFTITGGAERYVDRGIIPRSLSHIFTQLINNADHVFTIHITYLEIYNENGYDLLDPKHDTTKLEDLPKISLMEDNDGHIHLKNLSIHQATNEEEALNLLFLGDTNRMIAETPMNQASTRSHCIFTVHITIRQTDSATIRRSKLHLVDLAGSERVSKSGVGGTILKEAKYINLSLHYLEQVIIALSEKSRTHIPYRNSMMTSVLRDSLGGNCMTSMIATCSVEKKNLDESISTCRFAERVAMIKNDAILNEELDPKLLVPKLKREIQQLKDELSLTTGETYDSELSEDEKERLTSLVRCYIEDKDEEALLSIGADMRKVNYCFSLFKKHCMKNMSHDTNNVCEQNEIQNNESSNICSDTSYLANKCEVSKLKELITQRDNEINILVNMLKKEKQRGDQFDQQQQHKHHQQQQQKQQQQQHHQQQQHQQHSSTIPDSKLPINEPNQFSKVLSETLIGSIGKRDGIFSPENDAKKTLQKGYHREASHDMSVGRKEAFAIFKRDYEDNKIIEENKKGLKLRYKDAKILGEQVNRSRETINYSKSRLEKLKACRSLQAADGYNNDGDEEQELRNSLDSEKAKYKEAFNQLKLLKTEIEHIQHLLERLKMKMQKDFETWWNEETCALGGGDEAMQGEVKTAWRTPPLSPTNPQGTPPNVSDEKSIHSVQSLLGSSTSRLQKSNMTGILGDSGRHSITSMTTPPPRTASAIRLTGDEKTDEDILAFMKARDELTRKTKR